jgi:hypothetical protein
MAICPLLVASLNGKYAPLYARNQHPQITEANFDMVVAQP